MSADNSSTEPQAPESGSSDQGQTAKGADRTFSQAELDQILAKRLGDVAELKRKASELDKLTEAQKSEQQKAAERIAQLERELSTAQLAQLRRDVGERHGLTATQARRLVGTTEDELTADAEELAKDLGLTKPKGKRTQEALKPAATADSGDEQGKYQPMDDIMRNRMARSRN